jgi:integrase/recombinase XerD
MPPRRRPTTDVAAVASTYGDPGQYLQPFVQYLAAECGMARNSISAYQSDLTQFLEWFRRHGSGSVMAIDLQKCSAYLKHLHDRKLKASSVGRHLVSLKMFFRYLVLEGVIQESVVDLLNSPKLWQHLPKVLSPDMVDRLLTAPAPIDRFPARDRALLALLYATGCRASEVSNLSLRDIQLEERYCRCVGKGNKERMVSLNPVAVRAIQAYLKDERPLLAQKADTPLLLLSRRGRPLSRIMVWNLVKKYARRCGASEGVSPHTLRHSFATHMLAGGAEIRALQELLGHANIATTQIYTHVEHSRLKSVHQKCHPRG